MVIDFSAMVFAMDVCIDLPISDSTLTDVFIVDEYKKKLTKYQMKKVKYVGHDARSTYESDNLQ